MNGAVPVSPIHAIQYTVSVILFQLEIEHGMKIISRR